MQRARWSETTHSYWPNNCSQSWLFVCSRQSVIDIVLLIYIQLHSCEVFLSVHWELKIFEIAYDCCSNHSLAVLSQCGHWLLPQGSLRGTVSIFPALYVMQTRSSYYHSVCLSVRLSVCHTLWLWQNGIKICPDLYTVKKRFRLVYWEEEWLVGDDPFYLKFSGHRPRSVETLHRTNRTNRTNRPQILSIHGRKAMKKIINHLY